MRLIAHALFSTVFFLMVVGFSSPCEVFAQKGQPPYLFKPISLAKGATLPAAQQRQMDRIRELPTTTDVQVADVDLNLFQSKQVTLNIGDGKPLAAVTDRVERRSANDFTWFGKIPELAQNGNAVLVVKDGNVTGVIRAADRLYEVVPIGGTHHAIIRVDQSKFPLMEGSHFEEIERFQKQMKERSKGKDSSRLIEKDEPTEAGKTYTIRAIFACTPLAVRGMGSSGVLEGKIRAAVGESNQSYRNSKIGAKLEVAHIYETRYAETGNAIWDLKRFVTKGDNYMDEVHTLRARYKADVGVLVVGKSRRVCGLAAAIKADVDNAFCLVASKCLPVLVVPHEIGHLMGARHNWEIDPMWDMDRGATNRGFWYKGNTSRESWATLMSYGCPRGRCARVPYWSNPDIALNGIPTGSHDCCNNVAEVNKHVQKMSKFSNRLR